VRPGQRRPPVAAVRVLRLPPRRAAGGRLRVRRAGAAQPALEPGAAAAVRARPGRGPVPRGATGGPRLRRRPDPVPRPVAAENAFGYPQLRTHRLRLHGWAPYLAVPGRAAGGTLPATGLGRGRRAPPGT